MIKIFIIFRPSLFTIHYFFGSLFTIHCIKGPLFTNHFTPSRNGIMCVLRAFRVSQLHLALNSKKVLIMTVLCLSVCRTAFCHIWLAGRMTFASLEANFVGGLGLLFKPILDFSLPLSGRSPYMTEILLTGTLSLSSIKSSTILMSVLLMYMVSQFT